MMLMPVRLPPGRARLATRPASTGSPPPMKTIGIVEVALFAASTAGCRRCHDHVDLAADEVGGQCGQPIIAALRPAVFDRHILSLDIAGFAQSLAERGHKRCNRRRARCCRGSRSPASPSAARAAARAAVIAPPSSSINSRRSSLDDLVGAGEDRWRDRQAERLAVLRLMTSSNLVGCWTGRSAGLAPFRILAT